MKLRQRPILISFSGIDGAGKSTQISALQAYLQDLSLRSQVLTFWDDVVAFPALRERASCKLFKGDQGIGTPGRPIARKDKNVNAWYMTAFRLMLYVFDAVSLRNRIKACDSDSSDVVIFDRYIYDEFANLPLGSKFVQLYLRCVTSLVLKPDISFLLDADPELAARRKPEYPLEFVHRNREAYIALMQLCGLTCITTSSVKECAAKIQATFRERCMDEATNLLVPSSI